ASLSRSSSASDVSTGPVAGAERRRRLRRNSAMPIARAARARRRGTRPMLHCRDFSPRPSRRHPKRRHGAGPIQSMGREIRDVNDYEILLLLDPELPDERESEILARIRERVEADGGTWEAHEPWGRRKLAYEIDHKAEGTYHLLLFSASPETLAEVSRVLKITDGVVRHLAVRRVRGGSTAAPPAPAAAVAARADDDDGTAESPGPSTQERTRHGSHHQPRRARRAPDARPRAPAHARRHGGLQPPDRRQHAPQGRRDRRVDREAELLRRHGLGQPRRELRAVPREGPPGRDR